VAALHSAALYALPVVLSGYATPRYAVPAAMLLVTTLVALLRPGGTGWRRAPIYALTALLVAVWAVDLRVDNARAHGPTWRQELPAARQSCVDGGTAALTIPPRAAGTHWQAVLRCDYVRR
jgi:hypothetical protein